MFVSYCDCTSLPTFVLLSGFHYDLWVSLVPSPHWLCCDQKGILNTNPITCLRTGSWSDSAGGFGPSFSRISLTDVSPYPRFIAFPVIIGVFPYLFYPLHYLYITQSS